MKELSTKVIFENCFSQQSINDVISNHTSSHTARGGDGVSHEKFAQNIVQNVDIIERKSKSGLYRFTPYREKLILKGADSLPRRVSIPTIRDRIVLRCLNDFLCQVFADCKPPHAHPVVTGAIRSFVTSRPGDKFIKMDLKGFYDGIDHKIIETQLRKRIKHEPAISLILSAITTPTGCAKREGKLNPIGVPQGLSISNILASIYMYALDNEYSSNLDISYHRYVDDILLRVAGDEAEEIAGRLSSRMKRSRKLQTHALGSGKSAIYSHGETVCYLGYSFKGSSVSVRDSSIKKMMTSLMRILAGITTENLEKSIWRLNMRISGCHIQGGNVGWLFYFSQINDYRLLHAMDNQVAKRLKSLGRSESYSRCKTFIKAHREIKYNSVNTSYIFNFDTFTRAQMLEAIYLIKPNSNGKFDGRSDQDIKSIFFKTMYREAREMERDTLGSFS